MTSLDFHEQCTAQLAATRDAILEIKHVITSITESAGSAMDQFLKLKEQYTPPNKSDVDEEDVAKLLSKWRLLCVPSIIEPSASGPDIITLTRTLFENMVKLSRLQVAVKLKEADPHISLNRACKLLCDVNDPVADVHECHRYVDARGDPIGIAGSLLDSIQLQTQILYQAWLNSDLSRVFDSSGAASSTDPMRHALGVYLKLVCEEPHFFDGMIRNAIIKTRGRHWRRQLSTALESDAAVPLSALLNWLSDLVDLELKFADSTIFALVRARCYCLKCGTGYATVAGEHPRVPKDTAQRREDRAFNNEQDYLLYLIDNELIATLSDVNFTSNLMRNAAEDNVSITLVNLLALHKSVEECLVLVGEKLGKGAQMVEILRQIETAITDSYDNQLDNICNRVQKISHANLFVSPVVAESLDLMKRLKEVSPHNDTVNMTCDRILNILVKVAQRKEHTVLERIQVFDHLAENIEAFKTPFHHILKGLVAELSEQYTFNTSKAFLATYDLTEYLNEDLSVKKELEDLDDDKLFSRLYLFYQSTAVKLVIPELAKVRREVGLVIYEKIHSLLSGVFKELHSRLSEPYPDSLPSYF